MRTVTGTIFGLYFAVLFLQFLLVPLNLTCSLPTSADYKSGQSARRRQEIRLWQKKKELWFEPKSPRA
jgi:hypothetical protein